MIQKKVKSEVTHHASEALGEDVTTAFNSFLANLTTFGGFQALQQLVKVLNVEIIVADVGSSHCNL